MKRAGFAVAVVAGTILLAFVAAALLLTNTVQDDPCTAAHAECAAMVASLGGSFDCRVEVYHCRVDGHFEFPDGSVRLIPADSADVGED